MSTDYKALAIDYTRIAGAAIEQTFFERQSQALQSIHAMDNAAVFADVLALDIKTTYEQRYPSLGKLSILVSEQKFGNGPDIYALEMRGSDGSGVDLAISHDLTVSSSGVQGMKNRVAVVLPEERFRWSEKQIGGRDGTLQIDVGNRSEPSYIAYPSPGLATDSDASFEMRARFDLAAEAHNSATSHRPDAVMAATNAAPVPGAIRAVTPSGSYGAVADGYNQSGRVSYNGFCVVEQQAAANGTVTYNKADLLEHASDRKALESALSSSDPIAISVHDGHVNARVLPRVAEVQEAKPELGGTGMRLPDVAIVEPWNGKPASGTLFSVDEHTAAMHIGRGKYVTFDVQHDLGGRSPDEARYIEMSSQGHVREPRQQSTPELGR